MDDLKRTVREGEVDAKEAWRGHDGEDLKDKLGNAGDKIRKDLGDAGDAMRRAVDQTDDDLHDQDDATYNRDVPR